MGGASLIQGAMANDAASRAANKQYGLQKGLVDRQTQGWDLLRQAIQGAEQGGFFDPSKRLAQQNAILDNAQSLDLGNQAGAARTLGYRPGDTAPLDSMRATSQSYNLQKQAADQSIIDNTFNSKLAAYGALNGGSQSLNAGIQAAGQQQQLALSRMQNPSGFLGALMPYLMQQKASGTTTAPASGAYYPGMFLQLGGGGNGGFSSGFGGSSFKLGGGNGGFGTSGFGGG